MGPIRKLHIKQPGQIDLLFETIKPIANDRKSSYTVNHMDDEEINTSAMARYVVSYARPTSGQMALPEENQAERERRAMEILINGNIVDAMNADP